MVKLYKNFNVSKNHKESIILIGNFDGVHLGHQKLFKLAKLYKKKYNLKIGVVNFEPMPKMFFNKSLKNFRLSSIDQKLNLLNNLEVDFIVTKKFDKIFSKTKSINFIKNILSNKLKAKFIFVSNNFRFGNKRELCAGSVAMVFEKMGGEVVYFGKPYPEVYNQSIDNDNKKILSIGDNLNTDIKGANLLNYDSLLISNGVHKNEIQNDGIENVSKQYESIVNFVQSDLKW